MKKLPVPTASSTAYRGLHNLPSKAVISSKRMWSLFLWCYNSRRSLAISWRLSALPFPVHNSWVELTSTGCSDGYQLFERSPICILSIAARVISNAISFYITVVGDEEPFLSYFRPVGASVLVGHSQWNLDLYTQQDPSFVTKCFRLGEQHKTRGLSCLPPCTFFQPEIVTEDHDFLHFKNGCVPYWLNWLNPVNWNLSTIMLFYLFQLVTF